MRSLRYYGLAVVIAAAFGMVSVQAIRADEMKPMDKPMEKAMDKPEAAKPAAALEVPAGSAAQTHNAEGIKSYNDGKYAEAEKHFAAAVKADKKSAEAHYNHALALDQLGKHKPATKEFDHALKLAPNNPAIADSPILKGHLERMKKK